MRRRWYGWTYAAHRRRLRHDQRGVRAARTGRRGRRRRVAAAQAGPLRHAPVPQRLRGHPRPREHEAGGQRDRGVHHRPGADHGTQGRPVRPRTGTRPLGRLTRPRRPRRRVPALRPARPPRRRPLHRRTAARRGHRGTRRPALRRTPRPGPDRPAALVPAAQEPRRTAPRGAAHAGGPQHPAQAGPAHRRRRDGPPPSCPPHEPTNATPSNRGNIRLSVKTGGAHETNLTVQANRMNLLMKKVTSWAAIIAVPTAITGFYGQNLPYRGYATHWGFAASAALIAALSTLLYLAFKRKDWL